LTRGQPAPPAFGTANLTNCEREQIHLAGSIQPHGALLVFREPDYIVVQCSANAREFLGISDKLIGASLRKIGGNLWERARPHFKTRIDAIPVAVRCHLGNPDVPFNALLHHPPGGGLIVELERAGSPADFYPTIETALRSILAAPTLQSLCQESAEIFGGLTGYDRIMIYRFDDAGHGEVFSEVRRPDLEAFLGNRYPSTDIPQIARRLYERNRVRLMTDVNYTPSLLEPRSSPITGEDLDMSLCFLRSVSPIHVQYLKNMGVVATLVVSLMVGGKLWGLISCHHYSPRFLHFEMRAVCELLAEAIGTRIAALESFVQGQSELSVRRLEQRLIESVSRQGDWRSALFDSARSVLLPLGASGAALLCDAQIMTIGEAPGTEEIRDIAQWLKPRLQDSVFSTASLALDEPKFQSVAAVASGIVAARISGDPSEILLWFRKERIRTVTWGGDPFKPMSIGEDPLELSPRRSFAQWHQVVEGTSDPWTVADLNAARLIGASVTDVILQFRSVRILIAQDQLQRELRQVRSADQQVLVANAVGEIIETNSAFDELLGTSGAPLRHLDELHLYFSDSEEIARRLAALTGSRQPWRGEVHLETAKGETRPLLVRADPVLAPLNRVIGFVVTFTDLSERKAAEAARRRFQESIVHSNRKLTRGLDSQADLTFQNLMSAVVENAQLAALEITYGADTAGMPRLLESLRTSVARTAEVLEHLSFEPRGSGS
jgi:two-component system, chemotaxis family, sensor kinase Cph1